MTTTDYTSHPEYQALLEQVRTNPGDDAPRLIIADWIEEAGDEERAEFIRSMIAVWNDDDQNTLTHKQHEHHDEAIQSWFTNRQWGPYLEKLFGWNWSRVNCCNWSQWDLRRDVRATWTKGFISEIRLTCAEFMGGPCWQCGGTGIYLPHIPKCDKCLGTGRIEGVAKALFERHPVTEVRLMDREPWAFGGGSYRVAWWPKGGPHTHNCATIPNEIYNMLFAFRAEFGGKGYLTKADANAALSRACVAYGRNLVGLPPM